MPIMSRFYQSTRMDNESNPTSVNASPPDPSDTHMASSSKKPVSIMWSRFTSGDPNRPQTNHCGKVYKCHYNKYGTSQLKVNAVEYSILGGIAHNVLVISIITVVSNF